MFKVVFFKQKNKEDLNYFCLVTDCKELVDIKYKPVLIKKDFFLVLLKNILKSIFGYFLKGKPEFFIAVAKILIFVLSKTNIV